MNVEQALDYLYRATVTDSSPADAVAEAAIAAIRAYIDELELLLDIEVQMMDLLDAEQIPL